jgi:hypothetical protein
MKTQKYNPSDLEVKFAKTIMDLQQELEQKLGLKIESIDNKINADNPLLKFVLTDNDGDEHEVILKIIQRPDKF